MKKPKCSSSNFKKEVVMANEQNLIPFNKRSKSEAREINKKGGIASGEARRRKRQLGEIANIVGVLKVVISCFVTSSPRILAINSAALVSPSLS